MGKCNLDHSAEDVLKKLESQAPFLPEELTVQLKMVINPSLEQETLNEIFHLLKKYDLADGVEQEERKRKLSLYVA